MMLLTIKDYVLGAAIAALTVAVGIQSVRLSAAQRQTAEVRAEWAKETAQHEAAARKLIAFNAKLQADHAAAQQQLEENHAKKLAEIERRRRSDLATAGRMRDQIAAYTTRGADDPATDAATCERARDRLQSIGGLLAESVELLVEGRSLVEKRDAEVKRLADQITADRAALDAARD